MTNIRSRLVEIHLRFSPPLSNTVRRYLRRLFWELSLLLPFYFLLLISINLIMAHPNLQRTEQEKAATAKQTERQLEQIKVSILFWQKVSEQLPNYRDAYLKLAILNYQANRLFDAQKYLQKALALDPNSNEAKLVNQLFLP